MLPPLPIQEHFGPEVSDSTWLERAKAFAGRLQGMKTDFFPGPPTEPVASIWYSGLVIEPAEFSQQLANLHMSMQQANMGARNVQTPVGAGSAR